MRTVFPCAQLLVSCADGAFNDRQRRNKGASCVLKGRIARAAVDDPGPEPRSQSGTGETRHKKDRPLAAFDVSLG